MHDSVREFVRFHASKHNGKMENLEVLDIGGRDVNGSIADLWPCKLFVCLDKQPGAGVHIVADVRNYEPAPRFDVVLCTSLLEHIEHPEKVIEVAAQALVPGGEFILTTHTPQMDPHGMNGEKDPLPGEYYHNFDYGELERYFNDPLWADYSSTYHGIDVFIHAVRSREEFTSLRKAS